MEDKRATAPGVLKKSTSSAYTLEEKIRNLEKKIEEYVTKVNEIDSQLVHMFGDDETTEETVFNHGTFTESWMPDNPPRVTPRDREIATWRSRTRGAVNLYCEEELGLQ